MWLRNQPRCSLRFVVVDYLQAVYCFDLQGYSNYFEDHFQKLIDLLRWFRILEFLEFVL
jgi:hypothetical protein